MSCTRLIGVGLVDGKSHRLFLLFWSDWLIWIDGQILPKRLFCCNCLSIILLSFPNGFSNGSQIGLKWKILWCSIRRKTKIAIFSLSYPAKHEWFFCFRKNCLQNWLSVNQMHSKLKKSVGWVFPNRYFKKAFILDQSGICSSNHLEIQWDPGLRDF